MNDVTKLPKWAQTEIQVLRMRLREANEQIATLFGGEPTSIEWPNATNERKPVYLPNNISLRFWLGKHEYIWVRLEGNTLDINGSESLTILPRAANHSLVGMAKGDHR